MPSSRKLQDGFLPPPHPFQAQSKVLFRMTLYVCFKVKNKEDTIIIGYKISLLLTGTKTINLWGFHIRRE